MADKKKSSFDLSKDTVEDIASEIGNVLSEKEKNKKPERVVKSVKPHHFIAGKRASQANYIAAVEADASVQQNKIYQEGVKKAHKEKKREKAEKKKEEKRKKVEKEREKKIQENHTKKVVEAQTKSIGDLSDNIEDLFKDLSDGFTEKIDKLYEKTFDKEKVTEKVVRELENIGRREKIKQAKLEEKLKRDLESKDPIKLAKNVLKSKTVDPLVDTFKDNLDKLSLGYFSKLEESKAISLEEKREFLREVRDKLENDDILSPMEEFVSAVLEKNEYNIEKINKETLNKLWDLKKKDEQFQAEFLKKYGIPLGEAAKNMGILSKQTQEEIDRYFKGTLDKLDKLGDDIGVDIDEVLDAYEKTYEVAKQISTELALTRKQEADFKRKEEKQRKAEESQRRDERQDQFLQNEQAKDLEEKKVTLFEKMLGALKGLRQDGKESFQKMSSMMKNLRNKADEDGGLMNLVGGAIGGWFTKKFLGSKWGKKIIGSKMVQKGLGVATKVGAKISKIPGAKLIPGVSKAASTVTKLGAATAAGSAIAEATGKVGAESAAKTASEKAAGKIFDKTAAKAMGKVTPKATEKIIAKEAIKLTPKTAAKAAGKTALKSGAKKIPVLGLFAGLGFGAMRAWHGDWGGASLEVLSGLVSNAAGIGTAASFAIDAYLLKRDIERALAAGDVEKAKKLQAELAKVDAKIKAATPEAAKNKDLAKQMAHGSIKLGATNAKKIPPVKPSEKAAKKASNKKLEAKLKVAAKYAGLSAGVEPTLMDPEEAAGFKTGQSWDFSDPSKHVVNPKRYGVTNSSIPNAKSPLSSTEKFLSAIKAQTAALSKDNAMMMAIAGEQVRIQMRILDEATAIRLILLGEKEEAKRHLEKFKKEQMKERAQRAARATREKGKQQLEKKVTEKKSLWQKVKDWASGAWSAVKGALGIGSGISPSGSSAAASTTSSGTTSSGSSSSTTNASGAIKGVSGDAAFKKAAEIARKMETNGKWDVAENVGDGAGISFGAYQFTEKSGLLKEFVQKLANSSSALAGEAKQHLANFSGNWYKGDKSAFKAWLKKVAVTEDGKNLQTQMWKQHFYDPAHKLAAANGITDPGAIAHIVDHAHNAGLGGAKKMLRMANGKTVEAIAQARIQYYKGLKQFGKFGRGWINRVNKVTKLAGGSVSSTSSGSSSSTTSSGGGTTAASTGGGAGGGGGGGLASVPTTSAKGVSPSAMLNKLMGAFKGIGSGGLGGAITSIAGLFVGGGGSTTSTGGTSSGTTSSGTTSAGTSSTSSTTGSSGNGAVDTARSYVGKVKYVWGGKNDPAAGLDCSGFVQMVVKKAYGIQDFPGSTETQLTWCQNHEKSGETTPIAFGQQQAGDILWFGGGHGRRVTHVALCSGPDSFIHSSGGSRCKTGNESGCRGVIESKLSSYGRKPNYIYRINKASTANGMDPNSAANAISKGVNGGTSSGVGATMGAGLNSPLGLMKSFMQAAGLDGGPLGGIMNSIMSGNIAGIGSTVGGLLKGAGGMVSAGGAKSAQSNPMLGGLMGKIFSNQGAFNKNLLGSQMNIGQSIGQLSQTIGNSNLGSKGIETPYDIASADSSLDILRGVLASR